ncbi:unnamed protein product [Umbelopsis vinacea]
MSQKMYHHVAIYVSDLEASKKFYDTLLKTLNIEISHDYGEHGYYGYGRVGGPGAEFGIAKGKAGMNHVAFACDNEETVKKFYEAGLAAGGKDNGGPGYRTQYGPNYYAAFVLDPDGNNIEIVWLDDNQRK